MAPFVDVLGFSGKGSGSKLLPQGEEEAAQVAAGWTSGGMVMREEAQKCIRVPQLVDRAGWITGAES
jgi:hypothetical protein